MPGMKSHGLRFRCENRSSSIAHRLQPRCGWMHTPSATRASIPPPGSSYSSPISTLPASSSTCGAPPTDNDSHGPAPVAPGWQALGLDRMTRRVDRIFTDADALVVDTGVAPRGAGLRTADGLSVDRCRSRRGASPPVHRTGGRMAQGRVAAADRRTVHGAGVPRPGELVRVRARRGVCRYTVGCARRAVLTERRPVADAVRLSAGTVTASMSATHRCTVRTGTGCRSRGSLSSV